MNNKEYDDEKKKNMMKYLKKYGLYFTTNY